MHSQVWNAFVVAPFYFLQQNCSGLVLGFSFTLELFWYFLNLIFHKLLVLLKFEVHALVI